MSSPILLIKELNEANSDTIHLRAASDSHYADSIISDKIRHECLVDRQVDIGFGYIGLVNHWTAS